MPRMEKGWCDCISILSYKQSGVTYLCSQASQIDKSKCFLGAIRGFLMFSAGKKLLKAHLSILKLRHDRDGHPPVCSACIQEAAAGMYSLAHVR